MNVTAAVAFGTQRLATHPELKMNARRDAELLLRFVLNCRREDLLAHPLRQVAKQQQALFDKLVAERFSGKPMQYITGTQQFWGLQFTVNPAVLIPRPETEHLVENALELLPRDRTTNIVDVGTGSGAIAIAIAHSAPRAHVTAIDISPDALAVAHANAKRHRVSERVRFVTSDLLAEMGTAAYDMIVSNPPYVAESDRSSLASEVRDHEPPTALFAGVTGYEIYRRLIPQALRVLGPGGWLLMEIGFGQHATIRDMLTEHAFIATRFVEDLRGIPRVAVAQRP